MRFLFVLALWLGSISLDSGGQFRTDRPDAVVAPVQQAALSPWLMPGDKFEEDLHVAKVNTLTGPELVRFLEAEPCCRLRGPLPITTHGGRMKHRALERIGELRYLPGVPMLLRDIEYWYPAVGEPSYYDENNAGSYYQICPAIRSLGSIGRAAREQVERAAEQDPFPVPVLGFFKHDLSLQHYIACRKFAFSVALRRIDTASNPD